jgi:hypothetical protein
MAFLVLASALATPLATADPRPDHGGFHDFHGHRGGIDRARALTFWSLPVVIDEPGVYVLDRDWVVDAPTTDAVLSIDASDVVLDFRGFALGIRTSGLAVRVSGNDVTLRNGRLSSDEQTLVSTGAGIALENLRLDTRDGVGLGDRASVVESDYHGRFALGLQNDSTVERTALTCLYFCLVVNGDGNRVADSRINSQDDEAIRVSGSGNVIARNLLPTAQEGFVVFNVTGNRNVLRGNTVLIGDMEPPSSIVAVSGTANVIDGNIAHPGRGGERAFVGIRFTRAGNFYGDNRLGALAAVDLGGGPQTDWGGNVIY